MKLDSKKLKQVLKEVHESHTQYECEATSVCIGKIGDFFVSIEVSNGDVDEEIQMEVLPQWKCID